MVPTTAVATGSTGVAAVSSWTLGTTAGTNTLTATATGLNGSPVTFTATGTAGVASLITVSVGSSQTATVGTAVALAPAVLVTDQFGNPVSGTSVTFTAAEGSVTGTNPVVTGSNGVAAIGSWTLATTAGADTLRASATGLTGSPVIFTATGTAGAPAIITVSAGDSESTAVLTPVSVPPAVLVTDLYGNPVAGVSVTWVPGGTGGTITGTNPVLTGSDGVAAIGSWSMGTLPGQYTLTATASPSGISGNPIMFVATAEIL